MTGEEAISYIDMDIEEAINDFSNRFIDEISPSKGITYTTKQLEFEKVIEHQRDCALAILQERNVFMAKPTGSVGKTDLPNDFLGTRLLESSFFESNWTGTKYAPVITSLISLVTDQTRQLRERNVDAIFLFVEYSMTLFRKLKDKNY